MRHSDTVVSVTGQFEAVDLTDHRFDLLHELTVPEMILRHLGTAPDDVLKDRFAIEPQ